MSDFEDSEGGWEDDFDEGLMKTVIPRDTMDPDDTRKSDDIGKSDDTGKWLPKASSGKSGGKYGKESSSDDEYDEYDDDQPVKHDNIIHRVGETPEKRDIQIEALQANEEKDIEEAPYIYGNNHLPEHALYESTKSAHLALKAAQERQAQDDARKK